MSPDEGVATDRRRSGDRTCEQPGSSPHDHGRGDSGGPRPAGGDLLAWQGRLGHLAGRAVEAGLDHLVVGDHVSFAGGHGTGGLIQATALLAAHPAVSAQTGVYLLALRHPAVVARQLSTLALIAPGRLCFGIGVGGDDRRELELCGVDPRTRGARTDEPLRLLRTFLTGEEVTFDGRFFAVEAAAIRPAPQPPVPILVGGRSDAAAARTGRLGEGWIGVWVSPRRRFGEMSRLVADAADAAGVRRSDGSTRSSSGRASAPPGGRALRA